MAKTSSIFASISPGMDIEQSTDGLVSAMKAFKISADDALDGIASKVNIIGNTMAVSNEGIVEFLTKSSAAMAEANNTLEDTVALGTAISEITRDYANAGQVMKVMSMRIRGIDEETEEVSEDILELTGKIADLTKTAKTPGGISLFTDASKSTYKSTVQILREISQIYDDLTDKQQAQLLEILGGKRNGQAVAAALSNFDAVEKSLETMSKSAGNAEAEMSVIADSIDYKLNRLKETGVGIAQDLFQRDSTKNMVDNLTTILELIGKLTKSIGGLGTALTAIMGYKGFKSGFGGVGILKSLTNTKTGFLNFFTQRQLSDDALTLGITHDDVAILTEYDKALKAGTADVAAMQTKLQSASPAAQTFATQMKTGAASVETLTIATKAAQIGLKMLNMAFNIGATLLISYGITKLVQKFDELIVTEKEAQEQHEELIKSIKNNIEQHNAEQKEIQSLIKEYQSYSEYTTYTAEQKEQLKGIQDQLIDTYGLEAEGIDLVNGKYAEQITLLDEYARKKVKENNANLWSAYEETKSDYDNNSGYSFTQNFTSKKIGTSGRAFIDKHNVYERSDLQKAFAGLFEESTKVKDVSFTGGMAQKGDVLATQEVTFALRTVDENGNPLDANAMLEQVLAIQDRIDEIRRDSSQQALVESKEFTDLQNQVAKWTEHYREEVDANSTTLTDLAKNLALTTAVNIDGVDYYADTVTSDIYNEFCTKLIEAYRETEPEVADAIAKYLDETYGEAFSKSSLTRMEVEAKKAEEYRKAMLGSTYDYEDYKEEINNVTKSVQTLSSAYSKLKKGEATDSDLLSLFDEFPELSAYANDTEELATQMEKLARSNVTPLVEKLDKLRKTVKDPDQIKQLNGMITLLAKMGNLAAGIEDTADALSKISASDYIKYDEENVQKIIDKLEKEKDSQNDILDSLKAQKEELEEIISDYEKTADVVGKFIDNTYIEPLNDRKSEIEDYYNAEIDKLKEENSERDRNIELQEKQAALANARKTKIRVYSETQGWHYEDDVSAIQKAEKELTDLENEITIDKLEKQRDAEIKDIEAQIKSWENYKDEWKKQVEAITEADEELLASKILGSDWHEKIAEQDTDVMNNFRAEYVSYNNRLRNQVNVEIANIERVISEREKEIDEWKDYKTEISNLNDDITDSNSKYLKNLNQFVLDENSVWQDRINHLMKSKEIVATLNEGSVEDANQAMQDALEGSGVYGIMKGDQVLETYIDKADALKAREKLIRQLVREQVGYAVPDSMVEAMAKRLVETLKIKKFARGGVASYTGLAWMDGTNSSSEVAFNAAQANELYNIVKSGNFGKMVTDNILSSLKDTFANLLNKGNTSKQASALYISFPNAQINAKDYDSFKGFMDRYTTDLLLKMQVGL